MFWEEVNWKVEEVEVTQRVLPRKSPTPGILEVGDSEGYHPSTPKEYYRSTYTLNLVISL